MPTIIYSFGFRHGIPRSARDRSAKILDVRTFLRKNPYHDKRLRRLRGTDKSVIKDIESTPQFEKKFERIKVEAMAHNGELYIACTGGHHRSVYIANRLGKELGVNVIHLNIDDK